MYEEEGEFYVYNGVLGQQFKASLSVPEYVPVTEYYNNVPEEEVVPNPVAKFLVQFLEEGSLITSEHVLSGGNATPPIVPDKEGYVFLGWDKSYENIVSDTIINTQWEIVKLPELKIEKSADKRSFFTSRRNY